MICTQLIITSILRHLSAEIFQVTLKTDEIKKLTREAKDAANKIADTAREVQHREEMIERLTNEITTLQQELTKSHEKLADYETTVQKLRKKLEQRTAEVCTYCIVIL